MSTKNIVCSFYKKTVFSKSDPDISGAKVSIHSILSGIKNGKWADEIQALRDSSGNEDTEKRLKKNLPAATFSACFHTRREEVNLEEYTNMLILDIDGPDNLIRLRDSILNDKYTFAIFISPRGNGLKILVRINGTKETHRASFETAKIYFETKYECKIDISGKDPARLCYVSYDPDLYCNSKAAVLDYDPYYLTKDRKERVFTSGVPATEIDYIFKVCQTFALRKGDFVPGNRNNFRFNLAATLNRCGVNEQDACSLIEENYIQTNPKWRDTVRSAYARNNHEYKSVAVMDFRVQNAIEEPQEETSYNPEETHHGNKIIEYTYELLKKKIPHPIIKDLISTYFGSDDADELNRLYEVAFEKWNLDKFQVKTIESVKVENSMQMVFNEIASKSFITIGHKDIDTLWGGISIGHLVGFIGMDETFKSFMALEATVKNAQNGIVVNYWNGEMHYQTQFFPRLFQRFFGVDLIGDIEKGIILPSHLQDYNDKLSDLTNGCIHVMSKSGFTYDDIKTKALETKAKLIIVDGVRSLAGGEDIRRMPEKAAGMKDVAKEVGAGIIALFHTSGSELKRWHRNANDHIKGGLPVRSHLDAFVNFSRLIDADAIDPNEPATADNISFVDGMFAVRAQNKRGKGGGYKDFVMVMDPSNLEIKTTAFDIKQFTVKVKEK